MPSCCFDKEFGFRLLFKINVGSTTLVLMFCVGSSHCAALDVEGRCYTWGRNEVRLVSIMKLMIVLALYLMCSTHESLL